MPLLRIASALLGLALPLFPAFAADPLRGHGGPVRSVAWIGPDRVVTASFDQTVIVWSTAKRTAERVLRFHEGAVNVVVALTEGCFASGGEDARIAIWCGSRDVPERVLTGHQGPVSALAYVAASRALLSGSFDRSIRTWDMASGAQRELREGHEGPVTAVALTAAGEILSASFDGTLRLWPQSTSSPARTAQLAAPANALQIAPDGEILVAGADGRITFLAADLSIKGELAADASPVGALALSPDGKVIAAAGLKGGVALIERATRTVTGRLVGPGLPVWSLAFDEGGAVLLTGGADRLVRSWDAINGVPLGGVLPEPEDSRTQSDERGALVFRACRACHTLSPDDGNRAGPTLYGVFGRRVGTASGYPYSEAMAGLDIVWNAQTISRLFELGPARVTPGSKMPEQTISDPADRAALVEWLERATRTK